MRVAILAFAAALAADYEPSAYGDARFGSLRVASAVRLGPGSTDMLGMWIDSKIACTVNRRLSIRYTIAYSPPSPSGRSVRRTGSRSFLDANCSESGPNVGFTLTARTLGFTCAGGRWKPGIYSFTTLTTEPTRKLGATASLVWRKTGC